jgi:hypothetical protein
MKQTLALAVIVTLTLGGPAHAGPGQCNDGRRPLATGCKKTGSQASQQRPRGMTRTEEESLNRGMSRNVLQSIEDQVRRQRIGN